MADRKELDAPLLTVDPGPSPSGAANHHGDRRPATPPPRDIATNAGQGAHSVVAYGADGLPDGPAEEMSTFIVFGTKDGAGEPSSAYRLLREGELAGSDRAAAPEHSSAAAATDGDPTPPPPTIVASSTPPSQQQQPQQHPPQPPVQSEYSMPQVDADDGSELDEDDFVDAEEALVEDMETKVAEADQREQELEALELRRRVLHVMLLIAAVATCACGVAGVPLFLVLVGSLPWFQYGRTASPPLMLAFIVTSTMDIVATAVAAGMSLTAWAGDEPGPGNTTVASGLAKGDATRVGLQATFGVPWTLGAGVTTLVAHVIIIALAVTQLVMGTEQMDRPELVKSQLKVRARARAAGFIVLTTGSALSIVTLFALPYFLVGMVAIASVPTAVTKTGKLEEKGRSWQARVKNARGTLLNVVVALYTLSIGAVLGLQNPAFEDHSVGIVAPRIRLDTDGTVPTSAVMAGFQITFSVAALQFFKSFMRAVQAEFAFKALEKERERIDAEVEALRKLDEAEGGAVFDGGEGKGTTAVNEEGTAPLASAPPAKVVMPTVAVSMLGDDNETEQRFNVHEGDRTSADGDAGGADGGASGTAPDDNAVARSELVIAVLGYLATLFNLPFGLPTVMMAVTITAFPSGMAILIAIVMTLTLFSRTNVAARVFQTKFGPLLMATVVLQYVVAALAKQPDPPEWVIQAYNFCVSTGPTGSLWLLSLEIGINALAIVLFIAGRPYMPYNVVKHYAMLNPTDDELAEALKNVDGPVAREMCMWAVRTVKQQESGKNVSDVDLSREESSSGGFEQSGVMNPDDAEFEPGQRLDGNAVSEEMRLLNVDSSRATHSTATMASEDDGANEMDDDHWHAPQGLLHNASSTLFRQTSFASTAATSRANSMTFEQRDTMRKLRFVDPGDRYTVEEVPDVARVVIYQYGSKFADKSAFSVFRVLHTLAIFFQSWVSTIAKVLLVVTLTSTAELSILEAVNLLLVVCSFFGPTSHITSRLVQPYFMFMYLLQLSWWPIARAFNPPSHFTDDTSNAWSLSAVGFRSFDNTLHFFLYTLTLFVLAFRAYVTSQRTEFAWQRTFNAYVLWTSARLAHHPLMMTTSRLFVTSLCGILFITRLVSTDRNVLLLIFCTQFFSGVLATANRFYRLGSVVWLLAGIFAAIVLVAASAFQVPPLRVEASKWFESCDETSVTRTNTTTNVTTTTTTGAGGVNCASQFGVSNEQFALAWYLLPWIIGLFAAAEQLRLIVAERKQKGPKLGVSVANIRRQLRTSVFTETALTVLRFTKERIARHAVVIMFHSRWAIIAVAYLLAALSQRTLPMGAYLVFFAIRLRGAIPAFWAGAHFLVLYTYQFDFVPDIGTYNGVKVAELCGLVKSRSGEAPWDIAALCYIFVANIMYTFAGHAVHDFMDQRLKADEILKEATGEAINKWLTSTDETAQENLNLSGVEMAQTQAMGSGPVGDSDDDGDGGGGPGLEGDQSDDVEQQGMTDGEQAMFLRREETAYIAHVINQGAKLPAAFKAFEKDKYGRSRATLQRELQQVIRSLRLMASFDTYDNVAADTVCYIGYEFAVMCSIIGLTLTYKVSAGMIMTIFVLVFVALQSGARFQISRMQLYGSHLILTILLWLVFLVEIGINTNVINVESSDKDEQATLEWAVSFEREKPNTPVVGVWLACVGLQLLTAFSKEVRGRIVHHAKKRSRGSLDLSLFLRRWLTKRTAKAKAGTAADSGAESDTAVNDDRCPIPCRKKDPNEERFDLLVIKVEKVRELFRHFSKTYLPLTDPPPTTEGSTGLSVHQSMLTASPAQSMRRPSRVTFSGTASLAATSRTTNAAAANAAGLDTPLVHEETESPAAADPGMLTPTTSGNSAARRDRGLSRASRVSNASTFRLPVEGENDTLGSTYRRSEERNSVMRFFSRFETDHPEDHRHDLTEQQLQMITASGYRPRLLVARLAGLSVSILANVPLTGVALIIYGAFSASFFHLLFVILGLILEGNRGVIQLRGHYWWPKLLLAICVLLAVVPVFLNFPEVKKTIASNPVWMRRAGFVDRNSGSVLGFDGLAAFVLFVAFIQRRTYESFKYSKFLLNARLAEYHRKRHLEQLAAHVRHEEDKARRAVLQIERNAVKHVEQLRSIFSERAQSRLLSASMVVDPPKEPKVPKLTVTSFEAAGPQDSTSSFSAASPLAAKDRANTKELREERRRVASRFMMVDRSGDDRDEASGSLTARSRAGASGRQDDDGDSAAVAAWREDTAKAAADKSDGDDDKRSYDSRSDDVVDEDVDDVFSVRCRMKLAAGMEKALWAVDVIAHYLALLSLYPVPLLKPKAKSGDDAEANPAAASPQPSARGDPSTSPAGAAAATSPPAPPTEDDSGDSSMAWHARLLLPLSFELLTVAVITNAVQSNTMYDILGALIYFIVIVPKYRWPAVEILRAYDWYVVIGMLIKDLLIIAAPTIRESAGLRAVITVMFIEIPLTADATGVFGGNADILLDFFVFFSIVFRLRMCIAHGLYATAKDRREVKHFVFNIAGWTASMAKKLRAEAKRDVRYALAERVDADAKSAASFNSFANFRQQQSMSDLAASPSGQTTVRRRGDGTTDDAAAAAEELALLKAQREQHQCKLADLDRVREGVAIGRDFQYATIFFKLIGVIIFAFGYFSIMAAGEGSILSSVQADVLPGPVAFIFLLLFLGIMLERYVYLRGLNTYKIVIHFATAAVTGTAMIMWGAWINRPSAWSVSYEVILWVDIYVSALQVKAGFPRLRRHNIWADKPKNPLAWVAYLLETRTPFLFEARTAVDYAFTRTTLAWESFSLVEELRHLCFERAHRAAVNEDRKLGDFALPSDKALGVLVACVIMVLLLLPLMLFSTFNPFLRSNMVTNLDVGLKLTSGTTIFRSTIYEQEPAAQPDSFIEYLKRTRPTLSGFLGGDVAALDYQARDIQLLTLDTCSENLWPISDPALEQLSNRLNDAILLNNSVPYLMIQVSATRQAASGGASTVQDLSRQWSMPRIAVDALRGVIDAHLASRWDDTPTVLTRMHSPFIFNQPSAVKYFPQISSRGWRDDVDCQLSLHRSNLTSQSYWCLECDPLFTLGNSPNSSYPEWKCLTSLAEGVDCAAYDFESRATGSYGTGVQTPLYYVVVSDRLPTLLDVLPNLGIIVFYTTFVLAAGQILRSMCAPRVHRAYLSETADPHELQVLISAIAAARMTGRYEDEQRMYLLLIDLIRDPTELQKRTGRHIDLYDANKEYIGGRHDAKSRLIYTL